MRFDEFAHDGFIVGGLNYRRFTVRFEGEWIDELINYFKFAFIWHTSNITTHNHKASFESDDYKSKLGGFTLKVEHIFSLIVFLDCTLCTNFKSFS